ncbi:mitogen-activated protein kinase mpkC [Aspergillus clavatus NRRL 1]|uniref:Mitogen-activated protein kinase mpkC n=1 Tax=Aspergillus clavatus (strain ATCC 1007 / CBS 513.65 / DSM 816 / NCTC 3887 / NRRL 1 / QM 1276 / 107) TaxID=344612 RepID=MPKC_ASPCL|nr:MAP kinase MpkC [Aspergillus clavatus NRRL 1]A1CAF0.1 RecName: Full=Mitogen-activated protein kinase mpkC; Short=MAP kinase C [Aspergillus clavatus NRRL 1]EAW12718.1 MAP kinase MpkC [Aspergillus clavatus NRRL 1]
MAEFVRAEILGTKFEYTTRYVNLQPIGMGSFGLVCSAFDQITQQLVALKKVMKPFDGSSLAKRTYREIKLLKYLRHENLICLRDIFISPLEDIYIATELLGTDLSRLLSVKPLDSQFAQYFIYQILRGLKYIHSANVIHRDLKPTNILINENCDLKICDFGLARLQEPQMTGYVSTRYYRAPEIMLTWQRYGVQVDIWSAGCILAEMLRGKPLFPGKDHVHQFHLITNILGNPPKSVLEKITSKNTMKFVQSLPSREPRDLSTIVPKDTDFDAIDLLKKMLVIDPDIRVSAQDALRHPYLAPYHDPTDEPVAAGPFDWSFNNMDLPKETWKVMIYSEVLDYLSVDSPDSGSMALGGSSPFDHRALDREFSEFFDDREGPM